ncbi:MAG: hypothetical protein ORN54_12045 [Cyclobacteriaceae bacterium]|nr:hypothetical protein [Cyclobacteriaceae bacterium]
MIIIERIILLILFIVPLSCANNRSIPNGNNVSIEIKQQLGNHFETIESPNKKYTLYHQTRDLQDHLNREFRFLVLDNTSKDWVHKGSFVKGYIKWISETELEFTVKSKNPFTEPSILKVNIASIN